MINREAILADPHTYLIWGDVDKPTHRPECECDGCERWRVDSDRPTRKELRRQLEVPKRC